MSARSRGSLAPIAGLVALLLLLVTPLASMAADPAKYSGIQDDDPNPLPAYASPQDKQLLDAQLKALEGLESSMELIAGPPTGNISTPGEYEALEGVLIRWGSFNALLTEFAVGITAASANLCTGAGTPYACCSGSGTGTCDDVETRVFILVENGSQQSSATSTLSGAGADMSRIEFITYDGDSVWIRDYGPRYIYEDTTRVIMDHEYNRPTRPNDNAFPAYLGDLWDERVYNTGLLHGGGNYVALSTGEGFLSDLALDPDEDGTDEYTEAEIVQAYSDYMNSNVTLYPRLPDAIDATGHIDMWMMPVSDTTFIVSQFSGGTGQTITDAGASDLQTRGYTVYRTPAWNVGSTHYTYTNAAIVNDKVFIPWYSGYATENAAAFATWQTAMPNHVVVQVDTTAIIPSAGAIHCVMQHVYQTCEAGSLKISGTVLDGGASPVEGVDVTADNGGGWATTDASGDYELCVPPAWSGTVTPDKNDYTFAPTSRSYVSVASDVTGQDYTATAPDEVFGPVDFQGGLGGWTNAGGDDFDWTLDSGGTPSGGTGPSVDHTTGTGSGTYLFTEASSPRGPGDTAILASSCIDLTGYASSTFSFWYHMLGAGMGTLEVQVASSAGASCASLGGFGTEFSISGEQGSAWLEGSVDLDAYTGGSIQIRVLGVVGSSYQSDMAIDDTVVTAALPAAVCGDGSLDPGEQCDDNNTNDGDCCSSTCQFESAATVCRGSADACDVEETCTGSSGTCPVDGFATLGTECRGAADICDLAEQCTGASAACPADGFATAGTECRASADICDVAEQCTGAAAACPADGFATAGTECRASADICDVAEQCTGGAAACPADGFEAPTTVCRAAVGVCDVSELCTGAGAACPADALAGDGTPCLDGDVCNGDETCQAGSCAGGSALNCDDGDACTADGCDGVTGCFNDPIPNCPAPVPSASDWSQAMLAMLIVGFGATVLFRRRGLA